MHSNYGKRWTNNEINMLLNEKKSGLSNEVISKNHKRSISAITIKLLQVCSNMINDDNSLDDIIDKYNLDKEQFIEYLDNNNIENIELDYKFNIDNNNNFEILIDDKLNGIVDISNEDLKWNSVEREQLINEINSGLTLFEISSIHKRSISSIKNKIIRMAIKNIENGENKEDVLNKFKLKENKIYNNNKKKKDKITREDIDTIINLLKEIKEDLNKLI